MSVSVEGSVKISRSGSWSVKQTSFAASFENHVFFCFSFLFPRVKQDNQIQIVNILAEITNTQATMAKSLNQIVEKLPGKILSFTAIYYRITFYILYLGRNITSHGEAG